MVVVMTVMMLVMMTNTFVMRCAAIVLMLTVANPIFVHVLMKATLAVLVATMMMTVHKSVNSLLALMIEVAHLVAVEVVHPIIVAVMHLSSDS